MAAIDRRWSPLVVRLQDLVRPSQLNHRATILDRVSSHHPGYRKHRSLSFEGGMRVLVHEATPRGAAEAYFDTLEAALEEILAWQRDPTK